MSKASELYALQHSFSGDSPVAAHNRSGDPTGEGAERWNFVASVQSAEADIIDEEERAEQQEAKQKFAKLLWLYFKKILNPIEFEFLKEYLKGKLTPHKVGLKLGLKLQQTIDYKPIIISILSKHRANEQKFLMLVQYSGLKMRKNLSFLPQLEQAYQDYLYRKEYFKATDNEQKRQARKEYRLLNIDRERERKRIYRAAHRKQISDHNKKLYLDPEYRQKKREAVRIWEQTHREQKKDRMRKYRARNAEKLNEQKRERNRLFRQNATPEQLEAKRERDRIRYRNHRQSLTPEQLEAKRERDRLYIEQNCEKFREYRRKYQQKYRAKPENQQKKSEYAKRWYEQHKDEINARKREKRAEARETRKTNIVKQNAQQPVRRVKLREIEMKEIRTENFVKQKLECLVAFLRSLSYDFINKLWTGYSTATSDEEAMTDEERATYFKAFYCSVYNAVVDEVQSLYKIFVNNVSIADVKQEEKERAEQRRKEINEIIGV